jgi:flagellar hook-length control protein FliK
MANGHRDAANSKGRVPVSDAPATSYAASGAAAASRLAGKLDADPAAAKGQIARRKGKGTAGTGEADPAAGLAVAAGAAAAANTTPFAALVQKLAGTPADGRGSAAGRVARASGNQAAEGTQRPSQLADIGNRAALAAAAGNSTLAAASASESSKSSSTARGRAEAAGRGRDAKADGQQAARASQTPTPQDKGLAATIAAAKAQGASTAGAKSAGAAGPGSEAATKAGTEKGALAADLAALQGGSSQSAGLKKPDPRGRMLAKQESQKLYAAAAQRSAAGSAGAGPVAGSGAPQAPAMSAAVAEIARQMQTRAKASDGHGVAAPPAATAGQDLSSATVGKDAMPAGAAGRPADVPVMDQVVQSIRAGGEPSAREIVVQLSPPELGKIRITFREDGAGLLGKLEVDNVRAMRELEREASAVVDRLGESGISLKRIEVVLTPQGDGQQASDSSLLRDGGAGRQAFDMGGQGRPDPQDDSPRPWQDPASAADGAFVPAGSTINVQI